MTDSVYDLLNPIGKATKQRFIDYFSGSQLKSFWRFTNYIDSGATGVIQDVIGGGYLVTPGIANNSATAGIDFNNIRSFSKTGSVCTSVCTRVGATNTASTTGFTGDSSSPWLQRITLTDNTGDTYKKLTTSNTTQTHTNTSIVVDTAKTLYKVEVNATGAKGWVNGVLEVISSSTLPTAELQPNFRSSTITTAGAGHSSSVEYLEAYNT